MEPAMNVHDWNWCLNDDETMAADANQATREGWVLVNEGGGEARIEKIDCLGILDDDADALYIVCRAAADGSEYHVAALEHIRTHNKDEFDLIENYVRNNPVDYKGRQQPAFEDVLAAVDAYAMTDPAYLARSEGWALVDEGSGDARIERIDDPGILDDDTVAVEIVCRSAVEGSEYHAAALEHVRTHNAREWAAIEDHLRDSGVDHLDRPQPTFENVAAAVNAFAFSRMREIVDAGWSRPMAA
jgi:hypothetical protein